MLVGIESGEVVYPQQGGKKQRLQAAHKRLLAVMQQGKVVVRMRGLIGLYRLLELGAHRGKGGRGAKDSFLVEPMGQKMYAHKRQMGRDPDHLCCRGNRPMTFSLMRATLATIEPACNPPPVEMANAHDR